MKVLLLSLLCVSSLAYACERPIRSCEQAPRLAKFKKQLPGYVLASESDVPTKIISDPKEFKILFAPNGLMRRARSKLTCVVLVVDREGKVQDAAVSYPAPLRFTDEERKTLLGLRYEPTQIDGKPMPALISVDLEYR